MKKRIASAWILLGLVAALGFSGCGAGEESGPIGSPEQNRPPAGTEQDNEGKNT